MIKRQMFGRAALPLLRQASPAHRPELTAAKTFTKLGPDPHGGPVRAAGLATRWWRDTTSKRTATVITVAANVTTTGIAAAMTR
jgi:hypothetical protein